MKKLFSKKVFWPTAGVMLGTLILTAIPLPGKADNALGAIVLVLYFFGFVIYPMIKKPE